jgi:hypothetical protein
MHPPVNTKDPSAVATAVRGIYLAAFKDADRAFIARAFRWADDFFNGRYADYQPIDARYHDFEHTLQGTLCLARLLAAYHRHGAEPALTRRMFELAMLAILMHDTGYLKHRGDDEGTGAKYTLIHVGRSADFAGDYLRREGFAETEIKTVQNMIRCTGVNADLQAIPFQSEGEKIFGFALSTADLLGQMAAPDYPEKLNVLFEEFAETARYNLARTGQPGPTGAFKSAADLLRDSPVFWATYVQPKINGEFRGLYRHLNDPYPDGPNPYLQSIEANMARIRQINARAAQAA